ncbi:hypothetical protein GCM10025787_60600 [Saccharopolyspora rosea]
MSATASPTPGAGHRVGRVFTAVAALLTVVVIAGVATAGTATGQPAPAPNPTPTPAPPLPAPPPLPLPTVDDCAPGSPFPTCHPAPAPSSSPAPPPPPCQGEGCIPQPSPPTPPADGQPPNQSGQTPPQGEDSSCGITNIPACVSGAIESFFRDLVTPGLNSLLDLLAKYVLVTPPLDQLPVMGQIWGSSQQIVVAVYALLVLAAGVIVMAYETLQTRHSIKEVLPRVIVGFLAANLSLFLGGKAIEIANALSQAILGDQVNPQVAAESMKNTLMGNLNGQGGLFVIFMALALVVMLVVVLLTYIVRVTLTVILLAAAPLLLMCHALPQTEGIALWWWKAFGGVLTIQVGQSLALVAAIKLFFWPGGITLFS